MITQQHKTCENHSVEIDWEHTNSAGLPAVVCEQCVNKKGKRKGKAKFVCWLSRKDLYKMQFGANWTDKYSEHMSIKYELEERYRQQRIKDAHLSRCNDGTEEVEAQGNYSAYTG